MSKFLRALITAFSGTSTCLDLLIFSHIICCWKICQRMYVTWEMSWTSSKISNHTLSCLCLSNFYLTSSLIDSGTDSKWVRVNEKRTLHDVLKDTNMIIPGIPGMLILFEMLACFILILWEVLIWKVLFWWMCG